MDNVERRHELHNILKEVMDGNMVVFEPPESVKLVYPCLIYHRDHIDIRNASDRPYKTKRSYRVTIIDRDPDSIFPDRLIENFDMIKYNQHYEYDNLSHDVFTIYF